MNDAAVYATEVLHFLWEALPLVEVSLARRSQGIAGSRDCAPTPSFVFRFAWHVEERRYDWEWRASEIELGSLIVPATAWGQSLLARYRRAVRESAQGSLHHLQAERLA